MKELRELHAAIREAYIECAGLVVIARIGNLRVVPRWLPTMRLSPGARPASA
jgi:hypothetical protein